MPANGNDNIVLPKEETAGFAAGPVFRSATEVRFLYLAVVFGLSPGRCVRALRLS